METPVLAHPDNTAAACITAGSQRGAALLFPPAAPRQGAEQAAPLHGEGKGWEPCFKTCSKTPQWVELGEEGSYK